MRNYSNYCLKRKKEKNQKNQIYPFDVKMFWKNYLLLQNMAIGVFFEVIGVS